MIEDGASGALSLKAFVVSPVKGATGICRISSLSGRADSRIGSLLAGAGAGAGAGLVAVGVAVGGRVEAGCGGVASCRILLLVGAGWLCPGSVSGARFPIISRATQPSLLA